MSRRRRAAVRGSFTLLSSVALAVMAAVAAYVWFGGYNVAADKPHWKITARLIEAVRERSITVRARNLAVPDSLNQPLRIEAGADLYDEMCTDCHLAPGKKNSELRRGLNPQPPDLPTDGIDDPQTAFWTIKHGVKLTAMPAWGLSHTDQQIWDMVAFLRKVQNMPEARYQALVAAGGAHAGPHAHGAHGQGDEHGH
ncbi:MAG: cytochrome c [Thiobacillaceae bacterium]